MKFGTNEIQKVYLGTTELDALYSGTNEVYSKGGGFDEYTLGVWHLENNTNNAVSGSSWALNTTTPFITEYSNSIYKFGSYSGRRSAGSGFPISVFSDFLTSISSIDFTIDLWVRSGESGSKASLVFTIRTQLTGGNQTATVQVYPTKITTQDGTEVTVGPETWHHIAFERYGSNFNTYIDGQLKETVAIVYALTRFAEQHNYSPAAYFDEIRLSSTARYKGQDFTPPTQPY